jgi:hypothetical protein
MDVPAAWIVRLDPAHAARTGARCLDGSPGAFYWHPATSAASVGRMVIFLEGGGECRTAEECAAWRGGSGPSSLAFPPSRPLRRGEMSADPLVNPDMHDWAKLLLPYCSADMHSGTRLTPSAALGGAYFGGHNLIAASLDALASQPGFSPPSLVLVAGSSAGAVALLLLGPWACVLLEYAKGRGFGESEEAGADETGEERAAGGGTIGLSGRRFVGRYCDRPICF